MNEEEMITTYKEFEEAIKNGERKLVKGMGRLQTYQGLEYIKKLLENDKYYCEELEDSFVAISSYIDNKEKENKQLQNNWNELKKFVEERIKFIQEEKAEFEADLYNDYETNKAEITIRSCNLTQLEDVQERIQELEGNNDNRS
jgi:hypothetical protein